MKKKAKFELAKKDSEYVDLLPNYKKWALNALFFFSL